jgi:hypothetical protein
MNKSLINILGIGMLAIIIISVALTLTGIIPGKMGDLIIIGNSFVIAIIMLYFLKKK